MKDVNIWWSGASELFGEKFLTWILNKKQGSSLTQTQKDTLFIFFYCKLQIEQEKMNRYRVLSWLIQPYEEHSTVINHFRTKCGGTLPSLKKYTSSEDRAVAELAQRISPLLLLVNTDVIKDSIFQNEINNQYKYEYMDRLVSFSSFNNPAIKYTDWPSLKKLKRLAISQSENGEDTRFASVNMTVKHANGLSMNRFQLCNLDHLIINEALKQLPNNKAQSLEYFIKATVSAYDDFVLVLNNKKKPSRKVKVIFSGARIEGNHVGKINDLQWKFHKTKYQPEENILPPQQFELTIPQNIEINFSRATNDLPKNSDEAPLYATLSELDFIRFAVKIVNSKVNLEFISLKTISVPFSNSSSRSWSGSSTKYHKDEVLNKEDCKEVLNIIRQLFKVHESANLMLPIRRYLMSLDSRRNADDALIDLMIALEAMFSQGERVELSNRVASSVAFLLEPNSKKRRMKLYSFVKKSYDTRSKLVHGGVGKLKYSEVLERNNELKDIVVKCLKEIIFGDKKMHAPSKRWENLVMLKN